MSVSWYTTPLSVTSQFIFCGLPLRLDSYRGCAFQCSFCFARRRGGNAPEPAVAPAKPESIERALQRAVRMEEKDLGIVGQLLKRRVPIHFGGMSDPFQPIEVRHRVTRGVLKSLAKHRYPTVISTRGALASAEPYVDLLGDMSAVVVQFSFSSTRDDVAKSLEPKATRPSDLLRCMENLSRRNIPVTCRWQPYVPGISEDAHEFAKRVSSTGCAHVGFEHLKVPMERKDSLWRGMIQNLGLDLYQEYKLAGAVRDGRELVLPINRKVEAVAHTAREVRRWGMTFGAADNEFQPFSDTACCCSGADRFPGFQNFFKHQIGYALRKCRGKAITYAAIQDEWVPEGSVDRFLNSHSRIAERNGGAATIRDHIKVRWNQLGMPGSPSSFFGVIPTKKRIKGMAVYNWRSEDLDVVEQLLSP
jgi:DNA repair photolyase